MYDIVGFVRGPCHFFIRHRIRYRIKNYDVVYDMQLLVAIIRYRTYISYASSLLYVIVRQNRKKHTILQYDVACDFSTRTWTGVCGGSHWPCPWSADRSCLMILGPPRRSVLHCDRLHTLSLLLANHTATNVSGDGLIRAKIGISSGAWAAIITPTTHIVIECDRLWHYSQGRVRQVMFLCKLAEWLSKAEQCDAEWQKRGSKFWLHSKSHEAQQGSLITSQRDRGQMQNHAPPVAGGWPPRPTL